MKNILVTGFAPFGGDEKNASWEAVKRLPEAVGAYSIVKHQLPVVYDGVETPLKRALEELRPAAVLCVGQAAGRAAVTPEKVAINWKAADLADNAGQCCAGEPICPGEADAYFATLPLERLTSAMIRAGVPAKISYTAGTYVCNCTMYHLLRLLKGAHPACVGGFIHVPCTCEQVLSRGNVPSLPLELIVSGLEAAVVETVRNLTPSFA